VTVDTAGSGTAAPCAPLTWTVPAAGQQDPGELRRLAAVLSSYAEEVEAAVRAAFDQVTALLGNWQGESASAAHGPVTAAREHGLRLAAHLREAATALAQAAARLEEAQRRHRWSLQRIATLAAVAVVSAGAIAVTMGAGTAAVAAADVAFVEAEVGAAARSAAAVSGAWTARDAAVDLLDGRPVSPEALARGFAVGTVTGLIAGPVSGAGAGAAERAGAPRLLAGMAGGGASAASVDAVQHAATGRPVTPLELGRAFLIGAGAHLGVEAAEHVLPPVAVGARGGTGFGDRTLNVYAADQRTSRMIRSESRKAGLKAAMLPTSGRVRFLPPTTFHSTEGLVQEKFGGIRDRFENVWVAGPSRRAGEPLEWDVQLSKAGQAVWGRWSRDGRHLNVSPSGEVTHR